MVDCINVKRGIFNNEHLQGPGFHSFFTVWYKTCQNLCGSLIWIQNVLNTKADKRLKVLLKLDNSMHVFEFQMTSSLYLHVNRKLGRCCQYFSLLSEATFAFRLQAVSLFLENTRDRTQNKWTSRASGWCCEPLVARASEDERKGRLQRFHTTTLYCNVSYVIILDGP